jgi:hypothetical protein
MLYLGPTCFSLAFYDTMVTLPKKDRDREDDKD